MDFGDYFSEYKNNFALDEGTVLNILGVSNCVLESVIFIDNYCFKLGGVVFAK